MSINPTKLVNDKINLINIDANEANETNETSETSNKEVESSKPLESNNTSINLLNQSEEVIRLSSGFNKQKVAEYDGNKYPPTINPNQNELDHLNQLNQLSNETNSFVNQRNLLEMNAFDWIENQLMARFISKIAISEQTTNLDEQDYVDEQELLANELSFKQFNLLESFQGTLQLMTDKSGNPIDCDLIQALVRECLEEKIASLMKNEQENLAASNEKKTNEIDNQNKQLQPTVSPRKQSRSFELNKQKQTLSFELDEQHIETPLVTPESEEVPKLPGFLSSPKNSIEKEEQPVAKPAQFIPQDVQFVQKIVPYEDDGSILEETLVEEGILFYFL